MNTETETQQPLAVTGGQGQTTPPPATEVVAEVPASGMSLGVVVVVAIFCSLITSVMTLVAYDYFLAQKIVSADIKGFIVDQQAQYMAGKINDDQLRAAFDQMENAIKKIPKNKAVLMGDAVIQGIEKIEFIPKTAAVPVPAK